MRAICIPHASARYGDLVGNVGGGLFALHRLYNMRPPAEHLASAAIFVPRAFGIAVAQGTLAPERGGTRIDVAFAMPGDVYLAPMIMTFLGLTFGLALMGFMERLESLGWPSFLVWAAPVAVALFVSMLGFWWLLAFRRRSRREAEALTHRLADAMMALPEGAELGAGYRVALAEPSIDLTREEADAGELHDRLERDARPR